LAKRGGVGWTWRRHNMTTKDKDPFYIPEFLIISQEDRKRAWEEYDRKLAEQKKQEPEKPPHDD
jgi:hypothetical protein